ncbi:MAG TPA: MCE family protein, partial [Candidatus Acidoferrales bacterium]|nr:MCE family protein [Candidatus Acidoferrales bacterium]
MRDITLRIKGKWVQASLFAVALLALTAAVTFAFAPLKVFRPSYSLHTFFRGTEGLQPNSSVEMDGIAVGRVSRVRLGPRATDGTLNPDRSIEVILDIEKRFQQEILSDSRATVEVQGLLGNSFVSIRRGSSGKVLADWSEI